MINLTELKARCFPEDGPKTPPTPDETMECFRLLKEAESLLLEVGFDWTSDIGRKVREYFERRGVSQWDRAFGALPDLPDCEE